MWGKQGEVNLDRYFELTRKADAFFAAAHRALSNDMPCGSGCHDCCHTRFSITGVEAAHLRQELMALEPHVREQIQERAAASDPHCPALNGLGRCDLYSARPLICRTHGAPIRMGDKPRLQVVSSCSRCFTERSPCTADDEHILDQATLSTMLAAVNAAWARSRTEAQKRYEVSEVLRR